MSKLFETLRRLEEPVLGLEPWHWQEHDIEALIRENQREGLGREYKKSDALARTAKSKTEISKDVSAMANSAGGVIIYGIDEQKKTKGPIQLDQGIDPNVISPEWLEQVIGSGIQRPIDGVKVRAVEMSSTGKLVYVVWVPQSNRAPHMALDHRFHKRLGTTTAMMEEYELRDVGRRFESPDLHLDLSPFRLEGGQEGGMIVLQPAIRNSASEPAFHATCRLYLDRVLEPVLLPQRSWSRIEDATILWNGRDRAPFQVFRHPWSVPERHPILEGESYPMDPIQVNATLPFHFRIGWEIRTPKAAPKVQGLHLLIEEAGPRFDHERVKFTVEDGPTAR